MIPLPFIALGIAASLGAKYYHKTHPKKTSRLPKDVYWWLKSKDFTNITNVNAHLPNGNPLLIQAILDHRTDLVPLLLKEGANPNSMNRDGNTAIFYTIDLPLLQLLIKAGADVNATNIFGQNVAFFTTDFDALDLLDQNNLDFNMIDTNHKTPLHYLKKNEHIAIFLRHHANPNIQDSEGKAPFFNIHNSTIIASYSKSDADFSIRDNDGKTALFYLPTDEQNLKESIACAKLITERKPNVAVQRDNNGNLPDIAKFLNYTNILSTAIRNNDIDGIVHALSCGADPNGFTNDEQSITMLELAIYFNSETAVRLLIQNGADPNLFANNSTPLKQAISLQRIQCLTTLIELGAKLSKHEDSAIKACSNQDIVDFLKKTNAADITLFTAIKENNYELALDALKTGANPDFQQLGSVQATPIILAIHHRNLEIIKLLIQYNADINAVVAGFKPLETVIYTKDIELIHLLIDHGACVTRHELRAAELTEDQSIIDLINEMYDSEQNKTSIDNYQHKLALKKTQQN